MQERLLTESGLRERDVRKRFITASAALTAAALTAASTAAASTAAASARLHPGHPLWYRRYRYLLCQRQRWGVDLLLRRPRSMSATWNELRSVWHHTSLRTSTYSMWNHQPHQPNCLC